MTKKVNALLSTQARTLKSNSKKGPKGMVLLLIMVVGVSAMGISLALLQRSRWAHGLQNQAELASLAAKKSLPPLLKNWAEEVLQKALVSADRKKKKNDLKMLFTEQARWLTQEVEPKTTFFTEKSRVQRDKNEYWTQKIGQSELLFRLILPKKNNDEHSKVDLIWVSWKAFSPRRNSDEVQKKPQVFLQGTGILRKGENEFFYRALKEK